MKVASSSDMLAPIYQMQVTSLESGLHICKLCIRRFMFSWWWWSQNLNLLKILLCLCE
jgi:hypothetical protein